MEVLLALSPILLTLVLLLTRLPAWVAPAAGTAVAVLLALTAFGVAPGDLGGAIGAGVPTLLEMGAAAVFPPGTVIADAALELLDKLAARLGHPGHG